MAEPTSGREERREQPQIIAENLWVFSVFSCGSVPCHAHYTLFLPVFLEVYAASLTYSSQGYLYFVLALYGPVLLITVLIHELGHVWTAQFLGGTVNRIVLWPMGGYCQVDGPNDGNPADDVWIAVAGPSTHIVQALTWVLVYALLQDFDLSAFSQSASIDEIVNYDAVEFATDLSAKAAVMNVVLFILNLGLPAYPLDGGRALAAFLVLLGFKVGRAARITAVCAIACGFAMLFLGVYWYVGSMAPMGIILVAISCLIVHHGILLWATAGHRRLHQHALFRRDCYRPATTRRIPPGYAERGDCPLEGSTLFT